MAKIETKIIKYVWDQHLISSVIITIYLLFVFSSYSVEAKRQKDGKLASKFDEYQSTIKCMLNIAEETLPELNDFVACCGFWAMNDFTLHKVSEECDEQNVQQVRHMMGVVEPHVRDHCVGFEQGSFTCRLLVIMPITFGILFVLLILSVCVCSCVSFYKWIAVRRKYRRVVNLTIARNSFDDKSLGGLSGKKQNQFSKKTDNIYSDEP